MWYEYNRKELKTPHSHLSNNENETTHLSGIDEAPNVQQSTINGPVTFPPLPYSDPVIYNPVQEIAQSTEGGNKDGGKVSEVKQTFENSVPYQPIGPRIESSHQYPLNLPEDVSPPPFNEAAHYSNSESTQNLSGDGSNIKLQEVPTCPPEELVQDYIPSSLPYPIAPPDLDQMNKFSRSRPTNSKANEIGWKFE